MCQYFFILTESYHQLVESESECDSTVGLFEGGRELSTSDDGRLLALAGAPTAPPDD